MPSYNFHQINDMEAEALQRYSTPEAAADREESIGSIPKTKPKNLGCECDVMRGDEYGDNLNLKISFRDAFSYYAAEYRNGRSCMTPTAAALIEAFPYLAAPISLAQASCGWDGQPSGGSRTLRQLTLDFAPREQADPDQLSNADKERLATQLIKLYRFTPDELKEVVERFRRSRAELKDSAYPKLVVEFDRYYAAMLPRFYDEARKARNNIRKTARLKKEWKRLRGKKPTVNNYILQGFYGEKKAPKKTKKIELVGLVEPEGQDEPDKNRINAAVEASNRETNVVGERARQSRLDGWRGSETVQERGPGRAVRESERERLTRAINERRERNQQAREQRQRGLAGGALPMWRLVEEPEEAAVRERATVGSLQSALMAGAGQRWASGTNANRTGLHGVIYESPNGSRITVNADAPRADISTANAQSEDSEDTF